MAVRTIDTRLSVDGLSEYRAAMAQVNSALKLLASDMKLASAEADNNTDSIDALTKKHSAAAALYAQQAEKVRSLTQAVQESTAKYGENSKVTQSFHTQLNNAKVTLIDYGKQLDDASASLDEAKRSADGTGTAVDNMGEDFESSGKKSSAAVDDLSRALVAAGIVQGVEKLAEGIKACVSASVAFESAVTGVYKTIDGTPEQLAAITDGIQQLSTRIPATTTEIAGVAEAAGQLGIVADDILGFTEVMINLGEATNLSADEAASALAKFANVTGMAADKYDRLGSTIVALGNNLATTEADIVSMGTRIAAAGAQVGLSEAQIMGMAGALSSVGLEAEAGGTAISKLMINMQVASETGVEANKTLAATGYTLRELQMLADADSTSFKGVAQAIGLTSGELKKAMATSAELDDFANVMGITADEFVRAFGEDAAATISRFFVGLGSGSESAVATLSEMGIEEVRLRDTLLRLSGAQDAFTTALGISESAWANNTALVDEASKRYATTESRITMAKNSVELLKVAVGDALNPVVGEGAELIGDVANKLAAFVAENPQIVQAVAAIATALGVFVAGVAVASGAVAAFNAVIALNPFGAIAIAVLACAAAFGVLAAAQEPVYKQFDTYGTELEEILKKTEALTKTQEDSAAAYQQLQAAQAAESSNLDALVSRMDELRGKEQLSAGERAEMLGIVDKLNASVPTLALAYEDETQGLNLSTGAIRDRVQAQQAEIALDSAVQRKLTLLEQRTARADALREVTEKRVELEQALADVIARRDAMSAAGNSPTREMWTQVELYTKQLADLTAQETDETAAVAALTQAYDAASTEVDSLSAAQETAATKLEAVTVAADNAAPSVSAYAVSWAQVAQKLLGLGVPIADAAGQLDSLRQSGMLTAEEADLLADTLRALDDTTYELAETSSDASYTIADAQAKARAAYQAMHLDARVSLTGQIDLFADAADKSAVSIEQMIANIQKQAAAYRDYADNLRAVSQASAQSHVEISAGLLRMLNDNTDEAKMLAAAMADALRDNNYALVQSLSEAYADYVAAADEVVTAQEGVEQDISASFARVNADIRARSGEITSSLKALAADARESGRNFALGYADGIRMELNNVTVTAAELAHAAHGALRVAQMEQSPSKLTRKSGAYFAEGYALGITDETDTVAAAAASLGDVAVKYMDSAYQGLVVITDNISDTLRTLSYNTDTEATSIQAAAERIRAAYASLSLGTLDYSVDYSAMMLNAQNQAEFDAAEAARQQKIAAQNIDLAANGWRTNDELQNTWNAAQNLTHQGLLSQNYDTSGDWRFAWENAPTIAAEGVSVNFYDTTINDRADVARVVSEIETMYKRVQRGGGAY